MHNCDACRKLGTDLPEYELIGYGLRVHFKALQSAFIDQPKTPNRQDVGKDVGIDVGLADKILELISGDPSITIPAMAEKIDVMTRTVERQIKKLRETGRIIRTGGKHYGRREKR